MVKHLFNHADEITLRLSDRRSHRQTRRHLTDIQTRRANIAAKLDALRRSREVAHA